MIKNKKVSLSKGIEIIKNELLTIPNKSGVYQMIGENNEYLYKMALNSAIYRTDVGGPMRWKNASFLWNGSRKPRKQGKQSSQLHTLQSCLNLPSTE